MQRKRQRCLYGVRRQRLEAVMQQVLGEVQVQVRVQCQGLQLWTRLPWKQ